MWPRSVWNYFGNNAAEEEKRLSTNSLLESYMAPSFEKLCKIAVNLQEGDMGIPGSVSWCGLAVRRWAGKQRDLGSNLLRSSFLFKGRGLWTLSCDCPSQLMKH